MRICDWFDKYRDGELNAPERDQFEKHMIACNDCAGNMALLNNFVQALSKQELKLPAGMPEKIARRAFQKSGSWDFLVVSWIKPAPAWYAFALLLIVFSVLWALPGIRKTSTTTDYEILWMESEPTSAFMSASQSLSDDEVASWLKEGGN
jgi:anti-sigma factor RsiW